jgi:hypothetical protein
MSAYPAKDMGEKVRHEVETQGGVKISLNDTFYIVHGRCIDRACILAIYVFPEPVIIGLGYFVVHETLFSILTSFPFYPFVVFKRLLKGNERKEKQQNY